MQSQSRLPSNATEIKEDIISTWLFGPNSLAIGKCGELNVTFAKTSSLWPFSLACSFFHIYYSGYSHPCPGLTFLNPPESCFDASGAHN